MYVRVCGKTFYRLLKIILDMELLASVMVVLQLQKMKINVNKIIIHYHVADAALAGNLSGI